MRGYSAWMDVSGNNNHAVSEVRIVLQKDDSLDRMYLSGNTTASVTWPESILPPSYTLLYLTKYNAQSNPEFSLISQILGQGTVYLDIGNKM